MSKMVAITGVEDYHYNNIVLISLFVFFNNLILKSIYMRSIPLALLLLLTTLFSHAQVKYFLQPEANITVIPKIKNQGTYSNTFAPNPNQSNISTQASFDSKPGFAVKGGVQFPLNKYVSIETMAGLSVLAYKQRNNYNIATVNGSEYSEVRGIYDNAGLTYPTYLVQGAAPHYSPYVGENLASDALQKKQGNVNLGHASVAANLVFHLAPATRIGVGPAVDFLLWAKTYNEKVFTMGSSDPDYFFIWTPMTEKADVKRSFTGTGFRVNLHAEQQLTKHFALQASFSQAINRLYKDVYMTLDGTKPRMRYLSLGMRYYL